MTTADRSIVLFDNTKFSFAAYASALDELRRELEGSSFDVESITRSIRGGEGTALESVAEDIVSRAPGAVALGFADAGVTPATVRLAIRLRDRSVPAVVLAGDPGYGLAQEMTRYQDPDLPVIHLPLRQWMDGGEVRAVMRERLMETVDALLLPVRRADSPPAPALPIGAEPDETFEWLVDRELGDGLPVAALTEQAVNSLLRHGQTEPDQELIARLEPSGSPLTLRDAAGAAVLAGCLPQHFPFVAAALRALAAPEFALWQAATSTNPSAITLLASGPSADRAGIHSGAGCMGPGFRANATIGRAVNLALQLTGRATPGLARLGTQGSPAQYTFCFAENRAASPWQGLHADRFDEDTTTVTAFFGEGPHNVVEMLNVDAEILLEAVASTAVTLGANNAYLTGELMVVLAPDHAACVSRSGWTKRDVQEYLFERVRLPADRLQGRGQTPIRPSWTEELDPVPAVLEPDAVTVVVAGGAGGHSAVCLPWAMNRSVTVAVGETPTSASEGAS